MIILLYGRLGVMPKPDPNSVIYSPVKQKGTIYCPTLNKLKDIIEDENFDQSKPIYIIHLHQIINNSLVVSNSPYDVKDSLTILINRMQDMKNDITFYCLEQWNNQGEYVNEKGETLSRGMFGPSLPTIFHGIIETYASAVWRYHKDSKGDITVETEPTNDSDTFTTEKQPEEEPQEEKVEEQPILAEPVLEEEPQGEMDRDMARSLYINEYNFNNINDAQWIFDNIRTEGLREKIAKSSKYDSKNQQKVLGFYDILHKNIVGKQ